MIIGDLMSENPTSKIEKNFRDMYMNRNKKEELNLKIK